MPAIRDQSFSYATVTAGGTMTIPTPTWAANDLIFVFITGDTGTPTITRDKNGIITGADMTPQTIQ